MIKEDIEYRYKTEFSTLVHVYDNCLMSMNRGAYIRVGSGIDAMDFGVYEVKRSLEKIRIAIHDEIIKLSREVRFTQNANMVGN